jgi:diguanylate cyclase (GGDEF)-like protein
MGDVQQRHQVLRDRFWRIGQSGVLLGGEEFLLILTHVDGEQAKIAIERIRTRFAMQEFNFQGRTTGVTASFGVAGVRGSQPSEFNTLLTRADAALYVAKSGGRNRVEFDSGVI